MTHQIQAPWQQAHTQRMLEYNSTISTTNKSRLPPKSGCAACSSPTAFPSLSGNVFNKTSLAQAPEHFLITPGTPGSTKHKWQKRASHPFLALSLPWRGPSAAAVTEGGTSCSRAEFTVPWCQLPWEGHRGRVTLSSQVQFSTEFGTATAPFHIPMGAAALQVNAGSPAGTVPCMCHSLCSATFLLPNTEVLTINNHIF